MEWVKALHVISVIAWMAGMLYLPRLYVYHTGAERGSVQSETFKMMERRLLKGIINPAMILTWLFGLWMVFGGLVDWSAGWPYVKAVAVIGLTVFHVFLSRWRREFENDANTRPTRFYRMVNEIPTVLMIVIVIAVIVRPF